MGTRFISVFSGKGGVGKSFLTVALADYVSSVKISKRKPKVLVLDFDDQSSSSRDLIGEETVVRQGENGETLPDVIDSLQFLGSVEDYVSPIVRTRKVSSDRSKKIKLGEVDVIHSINDGAIRNYLKKSSPEKSKKIAENLRDYLSEKYDLVFIDLPGSNIPNDYSLIGLFLAERFILPTLCSPMEIFSFPRTFKLLNTLHQEKGKTGSAKILGVVLNMMNKGSKVWRRRKKEMKELTKSHGTKIYENHLTFHVSLTNMGVDPNIHLKGQTGKYERAWDRVRELALELLADLGYKKK